MLWGPIIGVYISQCQMYMVLMYLIKYINSYVAISEKFKVNDESIY